MKHNLYAPIDVDKLSIEEMFELSIEYNKISQETAEEKANGILSIRQIKANYNNYKMHSDWINIVNMRQCLLLLLKRIEVVKSTGVTLNEQPKLNFTEVQAPLN